MTWTPKPAFLRSSIRQIGRLHRSLSSKELCIRGPRNVLGRFQFVALRPKVVAVWFFDAVLCELARRELGFDDNDLAGTATHAVAEFQNEAAGRTRPRGMTWLSSRRLQKYALIGQPIDRHDPLRRERPNAMDLEDRVSLR